MPPAWFIEWAETVNLWGIILILSAVIGGVWALVAFVRKGWPWLKSFAKAIINTAQIIDSVKGLPDFIERTDATLASQDTKIAEIHHEVHYNNGSSVKDSQARTEAVIVNEIRPALRALAEADAALRADFERTEEPE
jgi:hypothetical protein